MKPVIINNTINERQNTHKLNAQSQLLLLGFVSRYVNKLTAHKSAC